MDAYADDLDDTKEQEPVPVPALLTIQDENSKS